MDMEKTTTLITTHKGELHKGELADLLGVPQSAQIYVYIPASGQSGESLDIQNTTIYVEWVETDELEML